IVMPDKTELTAHQHKLEHVKEKLASLARARNMGHQGLDELRTRLAQNPSAMESTAIKDKMAAVEELLGRIDKEHQESAARAIAVADKMSKLDFKISIADIASGKHREQYEAPAFAQAPAPKPIQNPPVTEAPKATPEAKPAEVKQEEAVPLVILNKK